MKGEQEGEKEKEILMRNLKIKNVLEWKPCCFIVVSTPNQYEMQGYGLACWTYV